MSLKRKLSLLWRKLKAKKTGLQDYERQQEKFRQCYPAYSLGVGSYGLPIVYDNKEGTTLVIGAYCSISHNVQIFLGGGHRTDWVSSYPFPFFFEMAEHYQKEGSVSRGDVIIGSDVWLCANSTILSGVNIGHGAVIANGAVVTRDVPPYAVMAGNPAKIVKWRFEESIRSELLAAAWWNWPEPELKEVLPKICSADIQEFIQYSKQRLK